MGYIFAWWGRKGVKKVSAYTLFQKSSQLLLDFLLPPSCVSCKTAESWLCQSCLNQIPFITPPICERCGTSASNVHTCQECKNNPLHYIDGIRSVSFFDKNPMHTAIHFLKYRNHKAVASILAQMLVDTYRRHQLKATVILPVPLHISRFRERGYNQSALLAVSMGNMLGLPVNTTTLQRTRPTQSQTKLQAAERQKNVAGAFKCNNNEALSGQTVLLIDDVCTTGSTLDACAAALKQSNVVSVWGLTLARA